MNVQYRIMRLFKRHPHYFVGLVSCSYPLSAEQIDKHRGKLLWAPNTFGYFYGGLSANNKLKWTTELLERFMDEWNWDFISTDIIGQCLWFDNILDRYEDHINWEHLSWSMYVPWTEQLLDRYKNKLNWDQISSNRSIPWTKNLIDKYEDRINFKNISNSDTLPISRQYPDFPLRKGTDSPMTAGEILDFIEKYEDKLDWRCLAWQWDKGLNRVQTDRIIDMVLAKIPVLEWPEEEPPF